MAEGSQEDLSDWEGPVEVDLTTAHTRQQVDPWNLVISLGRWVGLGKKKKLWTQLAGHQGSFQAGEAKTVLKKQIDRERDCYLKLVSDPLYPFVPEFKGEVEKGGEKYIQLQDLLCEFCKPCVMDVKMGCRTYHEEELDKARKNPVFRKDIYKKMTDLDPEAPTAEEREKEGVTKARYLRWRDEMSSSVNLSFRIEGIRKSDGTSSKDYKRINTRNMVKEKLSFFIGEDKHALKTYINRLKEIKATQEKSEFFNSHEVVGSSLLFVHDSEKANVWVIDFGKTRPLPSGVKTDHRSKWIEGNHEDEYFIGIDNLISLYEEIASET